MLKVRQHSDAVAFLESAEAWLLRSEAAQDHILLAVAHMLRAGSHFQPPFYLATVESDNELCGCALRAFPDGLYLTSLPVEAVPNIVKQLTTLFSSLPEVLGPELEATAFAKQWERQAWQLNTRNRCYLLHSVIPPARVASGSLRKAGESDLPLLREWAPAYRAETDSLLDMEALFELMVERGLLFLWDDDGARCLVITSSLTPNGAQLSALYTPPECRGRGYATSAAAAASQRVLDSGRQYCLTAAIADSPGPHRLYESIGYEPSEELVVIHFDGHEKISW